MGCQVPQRRIAANRQHNGRVRARLLPADLARALRRAREVEHAAGGLAQRRRAVAATGSLMLACVEAGWRPFEVSAALGLDANTGRKRVSTARARLIPAGITVVGPPPPRPSRASITARPAHEREWLRATEAAATAGVTASTINRWQQAGLLPNTDRAQPRRPLYLRADVRRVSTAPRWRNGGIDAGTVRRGIVEAGI